MTGKGQRRQVYLDKVDIVQAAWESQRWAST
jgi:hypothetical protein